MALLAIMSLEILYGPASSLPGELYIEAAHDGAILYDSSLSTSELDFICGVFRLYNCECFGVFHK